MTKQYRKQIFRKAHRDDNEGGIVTVLDTARIPYCLMPPEAGFDILVMTGPMEAWEVKNPAYKWTLTKAEHERKDYCKRNGITYRVIENIEQAVNAINERKI
jgi:hypothetical protein